MPSKTMFILMLIWRTHNQFLAVIPFILVIGLKERVVAVEEQAAAIASSR
jgi:hypothetical protein